MGCLVGDIPGNVEYVTKEFGLETLDALVSLAEPHNSTPYVHIGLRMVLYIFTLCLMGSFDEPLISRRRSPNFLLSSTLLRRV